MSFGCVITTPPRLSSRNWVFTEDGGHQSCYASKLASCCERGLPIASCLVGNRTRAFERPDQVRRPFVKNGSEPRKISVQLALARARFRFQIAGAAVS
jgi:hypothetical protein